MKQYHMQENYIHRETVEHFDDTPFKDEWQKEVYEYAKNVAVAHNYSVILDYGCGSGYKLITNFENFKTIGIDLQPTVDFLKATYPDKQWDTDYKIHQDVDLFIASDVIEHLIDPDVLLEYIKQCNPKEIILSTPDRNLANINWSYNENGPTSNTAHAREWNFQEFESYISEHFDIISHVITNNSQCTQMIHCKIKQ